MPIERNPCVYILASRHYGTLYIGVTSELMGRLWQHRNNGTLYIGVTSDLMGRLWQHLNNAIPGFTSRYGVYRLVYFEMYDDMDRAIAREKQLKNWHRQWKINLINGANPDWHDLAVGLGFEPMARRRRQNGP